MTPHFKIWSCENCDEEFVNSNCFGQGKYCAHDSNHPEISGQKIILEDLRSLCIYNQYYPNFETRYIWWNYQKIVHKMCYGAINFKCSQNAHKEIGIDWKSTIDC